MATKQVSERTKKRRAEVLRWVKKNGRYVTDAWSAYVAAKAGVPWGDYVKAKEASGFSNAMNVDPQL